MRRRTAITWPRPLLLGSLLALLLAAPPALGHKVKLFATCEGKTISGFAYFPGGGRVRNAAIKVFGPDGRQLGETVTDAAGEFTFAPAGRFDHRFVLDPGDGHRAAFTVARDELPAGLAPGGVKPGLHAGAGETPVGGRRPPAAPAAATPVRPADGDAEIHRLVEEAVARQLRPLRERIERYEEKTRLRDVLGGIGYILGIAGVLFLCTGRRRNPEPP